jgi:integral membrane protein
VAQPPRSLRGSLVGKRPEAALARYRIMAYVVGVMLIVVFCAIPFDSVEAVVGPLHGVFYLVYLVTVLDVFVRWRLRLPTLLAMVAGGWVPFLAFVVERWVSGRLRAGTA